MYPSSSHNALAIRESANNLHIAVAETFAMPQARAIVDLLRSRHARCNRFFIDVRQVTRLEDDAVSALRDALPASPVGMQRIAFKGSQGFHLAVNGNRVLIVPEHAKHTCTGNCPNCTCGHKKARARSRNMARAAAVENRGDISTTTAR
ncbi:squalene cyclase [uncultured Desulfovibrio sp.]|uniref:squalene cyclase n=1 Tax=uncultured Desulfovibrio sp. TaxID=167968 RepID=UPI0026178256|nr:squalene cyclase [uncultured Desulfovibrio sp.]